MSTLARSALTSLRGGDAFLVVVGMADGCMSMLVKPFEEKEFYMERLLLPGDNQEAREVHQGSVLGIQFIDNQPLAVTYGVHCASELAVSDRVR